MSLGLDKIVDMSGLASLGDLHHMNDHQKFSTVVVSHPTEDKVSTKASEIRSSFLIQS